MVVKPDKKTKFLVRCCEMLVFVRTKWMTRYWHQKLVQESKEFHIWVWICFSFQLYIYLSKKNPFTVVSHWHRFLSDFEKGTTYKSSLQFLLLYLANKKIFQYVKKTETSSYSCFFIKWQYIFGFSLELYHVVLYDSFIFPNIAFAAFQNVIGCMQTPTSTFRFAM